MLKHKTYDLHVSHIPQWHCFGPFGKVVGDHQDETVPS
jgi:hypothetical protein